MTLFFLPVPIWELPNNKIWRKKLETVGDDLSNEEWKSHYM